MTEVVQVALGLAVGEILVLSVLILRRPMALERGQVRNGDRGLRMRKERERSDPPILHLVSLLGHPQLLTSHFKDETDNQRVLFSPDAEEQLVSLGVSREHVETVVAYPTYTARRSKAFAVQLERDFGGHTLPLRVAEPWPSYGTVYVKQVEWSDHAASPLAAGPTPRLHWLASCHRPDQPGIFPDQRQATAERLRA